MRSLAFVLVLAVAAGCLAADVEPRAPAPRLELPPVLGEPIVQEHDHNDPALHNGSHNLRLVAHVKPWGDGTEYGVGNINELAINGNHVYISRTNPEGGFAIVDMSDPREPVVVGDFRGEGGADVEVTSDGAFALYSTQRTLPGQQSTDSPTSRAPRGVYVVDVQDKARPTLSSFFPLPPNGPHTIHYHRASAELELVAVQTYDLFSTYGVPVPGNAPATHRVYLTRLVRDAAGAHLEPLSVYQHVTVPTPGAFIMPHDVFIETHPQTGQRLMYVAYWDAGLRIVDISDPSMPQEIAVYDDFAPSAIAAMHDARTFPVPLGGRHVTVVGPEIVTAPEDGQITFVDTTDPASPTKIGWWSIPGELVIDQPLLFSPHVFDTDTSGRVVIGHYHGGVWLIDASDPSNATSVGYYLPHEAREGEHGPRPNVWAARFFRGYVLATDQPTGLYVLETDQGPLPGAPVARVG